jgi:hypothetical protein
MRPGRRGASVATIAGMVSGFAFEESRNAIPGGLFLWEESIGRGRIICMADDPAFRTFTHGVHRLLLNAILLPATRWQSRGE